MALIHALSATCLRAQTPVFPIPIPSPVGGSLPFLRRLSVSYLSTTRSIPLQIACGASRRITSRGRHLHREQIEESAGNFEEEEDFDEEDDDDDEDRSLDLFVRFVHNIFKKISKRARKATASILPSAISPRLVAFSVNGVIILTFLSILKAFLETGVWVYWEAQVYCCALSLLQYEILHVGEEIYQELLMNLYVEVLELDGVELFQMVVCTLGSVVFAVILLVRLIWSAVTYMQISGKNVNITRNDGDSSYGTFQPAT